MPARRVWVIASLVAAVIGVTTPSSDAAASASEERLAFETAAIMLVQSDTIDGQVAGAAKETIRALRRSWRMVHAIYSKAAGWWWLWFRRAAFSLGVAVVASLADAGLLNAFRLEGIRALVTYVPLMLYVYARLLFSRGVSLLPKLVLVGAVIYGVVRRDLVPDIRLSGRIEDIILIVIATRAFIHSCPEELVEHHAQRAIGFRRRVAQLQQRSR